MSELLNTSALISRCRELAAKATEGPWVSNGQSINQFVVHPDGHTLLSGSNSCGDDDYSLFTEDDCAFIAEARSAVPLLCDALEQAREYVEVMNHDMASRCPCDCTKPLETTSVICIDCENGKHVGTLRRAGNDDAKA